MNERIRELVRQAGLDDADFPIEDWDNVPLAKFAQLIVIKCLDIVDKKVSGMVGVAAMKEIEEYFGVKE